MQRAWLKCSMWFVVLAFASARGAASELRTGPLQIDWPAGYTLKSTQSPYELIGPQGARVLVTVLRGSSPREAASAPSVDMAKLEASNERLLTTHAQATGKVKLPMSREVLADGSVLQSIGVEVAGAARRSYFLQYMVTSTTGLLGLVTFEGAGDVLGEHGKLHPMLAAARWRVGDDVGAVRGQTVLTQR